MFIKNLQSIPQKVHRVRVPRCLQDCHGYVRHSVARSPDSFLMVRPRTALWYTRKKFCPSHHLCLARPLKDSKLKYSTEGLFEPFLLLTPKILLHLMLHLILCHLPYLKCCSNIRSTGNLMLQAHRNDVI